MLQLHAIRRDLRALVHTTGRIKMSTLESWDHLNTILRNKPRRNDGFSKFRINIIWKMSGTFNLHPKRSMTLQWGNVWKSPGFIEKTHWAGFFRVLLGFFGFYWVLSGFIGFFVRIQFLPDQIMVLLNFNFRFSSKYITFYAETMILTCKSDQSKFICMAFAWYLVKKTVF